MTAFTFRPGLADNRAAIDAVLHECDPLQEGAAGLETADCLVVGYHGAAPMGFAAGSTGPGGTAIAGWFRLARAWQGKPGAMRALWSAWVAQAEALGHPHIVVGVPTTDPPRYRARVTRLLRLAQCAPIGTHDGAEWFARSPR